MCDYESREWFVENGLIVRMAKGGTGPEFPKAAEIYEAIFSGGSDGLEHPLHQHGISFSPYPLDLHIVLDRSPKNDRILCSVVAKGENVQLSLDDAILRVVDYAIFENTWLPFARGGLEHIQGILAGADIAKLGEIKLRQYLALAKSGASSSWLEDRTGDLAAARNVHASTGEAEVQSIKATLYPYQADGVKWLRLISREDLGGILGDEMGLGKTIQVIALLAEETTSGTPSCVIAPATILENWSRELRRFSPQLRVVLHQGASRTGFPKDLLIGDVVLISYDTAVRDIGMLKMIPWNIVVLDEAQAIKNANTRRTVVIKTIPRRVGLAVTGTPLENHLTDLWSIVDFVIPSYFGTQADFEGRFTNDQTGAKSLEPLISPILLRRTVSEVAADLPEKIEIPVSLQLSEARAAEYEQIRSQIGTADRGRTSLLALAKLRQFCAHPLQLSRGSGDLASDFAKYERLAEILEEILAVGEKVLIFLQYHHLTDLMLKDLRRRFGCFVDWIDGRVNPSERQLKVDRFSETLHPAILLLHPRTAGVGLNITAANHVIHYHPDWNPAVQDQASARAYRRGQSKPVTIHQLYFVNTVEDVIVDRLLRKRSLFESAVVGTKAVSDDYEDIMKAIRVSPLEAFVK